MDQGPSLVEVEQGEGNAELGGHKGNAALPVLVLGVEVLNLPIPLVELGALLQLRPDPVDIEPVQLHAARDAVSLLVQVGVPHTLHVHSEFPGHVVHPGLCDDHALRPAKAPERCVGRDVRLANPAVEPGIRVVVAVVRVQHGPLHHGGGQVERVAPIVIDLQVHRQDLALGIEAHLVLAVKSVAVPRHLHVLVPVQAQSHGSLQVVGRDGGGAVDEDRPGLLTAETSAEPLGLAHHLVLRDAQDVGDGPLVLGRRLGGRVGQDLVALLRDDHARVGLQVKVVLRPDLHVPLNNMGAGLTREARVHVPPLHPRLPVGRVEAVLLDGLLNGHDVRQVLVGDCHLPGGIPGLLLRLRDHQADDLADAGDLLRGKALLVRDHRANVVPTLDLFMTVVAHHAGH
mmetsp:Transcript_4255/g.14886  ORF Transcript_4255/g.14886 Transcript_4255/m.14886 type:complete len:400 (+) Transcript_4255:984-2183(+)